MSQFSSSDLDVGSFWNNESSVCLPELNEANLECATLLSNPLTDEMDPFFLSPSRNMVHLDFTAALGHPPAATEEEPQASPVATAGEQSCPVCHIAFGNDLVSYHDHVSNCFLDKRAAVGPPKKLQKRDMLSTVDRIRRSVANLDLRKRISLLESLNNLAAATARKHQSCDRRVLSAADNLALSLLYGTPSSEQPSSGQVKTEIPVFLAPSPVIQPVSLKVDPNGSADNFKTTLPSSYVLNCTTPTPTTSLPRVPDGAACFTLSESADSKSSYLKCSRHLSLSSGSKRKREVQVVQALPFSPQPAYKLEQTASAM